MVGDGTVVLVQGAQRGLQDLIAVSGSKAAVAVGQWPV